MALAWHLVENTCLFSIPWPVFTRNNGNYCCAFHSLVSDRRFGTDWVRRDETAEKEAKVNKHVFECIERILCAAAVAAVVCVAIVVAKPKFEFGACRISQSVCSLLFVFVDRNSIRTFKIKCKKWKRDSDCQSFIGGLYLVHEQIPRCCSSIDFILLCVSVYLSASLAFKSRHDSMDLKGFRFLEVMIAAAYM